MPGTRQTTAVLERRHEVATRYLHGEQQSVIAQSLGLSQPQISLDLKAIREMWLASLVRDFDAAKAIELARVDEVEHSYWQGWQRSLQPREVTLTEATEGDGAPKRKASVRKEGQAGDPRFLDGVLKCVERRCKILGLDAPQQFKVDWEALSDAQLYRLAAGENPAQVLMAEA